VKHMHYDEVEAQPVSVPGAERVRVRWLISDDDGAPVFAMRRFEVAPGGQTPLHTHEWEHEVYILEGEGTAVCNGIERKFVPGDFLFIAPNEEHCFRADAGENVSFLCLIPNSGR